MSDRPMIEAEGLQKRYAAEYAVRSVDLAVPAGRILGVLGPNGAGKSTTVRMLTTMTRPDGGAARVGGFDVVGDARAVRGIIGVTGQDASLDELLTGTQNLVMVGELSKLPRRGAQARAAELLERFGLTDAAGRMVKTYSGGMRRRLDLAASLMARPPVLFLDEPTTGLDPASRQSMWGVIRDLVAEGTTVLLTTQYLDEADALADAIVVIDHGTVIATGTARELKARIGGEQLEVTLAAGASDGTPTGGDISAPALAPAARTDDAIRALAPLVAGPVHVTDEGRRLVAPIIARHGIATAVIRALDGVGVAVDDIAVHRPSLDDVFFALTGRPADPAPAVSAGRDSEPAARAPGGAGRDDPPPDAGTPSDLAEVRG